MSLIQNIQKKSQAEKIKIIWAVVIIVSILLLALWIMTSKISRKYFSGNLFHTVNSQFSDEQKFYQQDLKDKGMEVPDRLHLVR